MRLKALGDDQLDDPEVGGLAIHLHPRVLGRVGLLLVRGQQRVLERDHQLLRLDAFSRASALHRLKYFP